MALFTLSFGGILCRVYPSLGLYLMPKYHPRDYEYAALLPSLLLSRYRYVG